MMSAIDPREHGFPEPPALHSVTPPVGTLAVIFDIIGLPLQTFGALLALGLVHVAGGDHFSRLVGVVAIIVANTGGLSLPIPLVGVTKGAFALWSLITTFYRFLLPIALIVGGVDLFGRV